MLRLWTWLARPSGGEMSSGDDDFERHALRRWLSDTPGHPLGRGMPMGHTLREDGESHLQAWARIVRSDPCGFCGDDGGTVDHVVPRNPLVAVPLGGKWSWLNYSSCCPACNERKGSLSLLWFLWVRAASRPRAPAA